MLKNIVGVYFDLFGTLFDARHKLTNIWSQIAKKSGFAISPSDPRIWDGILRQNNEFKRLDQPFITLSRDEKDKLNTYVLDVLGIDKKGSQGTISKEFELEYHNSGSFRLNPGCKKTLEQISNMEIKLGILSNGSSMFWKTKLDEFGILDFFDIFIFAADLSYNKSQIKVYQMALDAMETKNPENIMHVGDDSIMDVQMAKEVGMIPVYFDPEDLDPLNNVITIKKLPEVLNYLLSK